MADVFEELSITLSLLIFSAPHRIAGNSLEIHYLLPPCLFQICINALIFKLLHYRENFFRGLSLMLLVSSENMGTGWKKRVGGRRDPERGKDAEEKRILI